METQLTDQVNILRSVSVTDLGSTDLPKDFDELGNDEVKCDKS